MNLQNIYLKLRNMYPNMDDNDIRRMAWVERDRKIYESMISKSSNSSNVSSGKNLIKQEEVSTNIISIKIDSFEFDVYKIEEKWTFKALLGGDILIDIIFIQKVDGVYNLYLFDEEDYDDFPFELIATSQTLLGEYTILNNNFNDISTDTNIGNNYCLNYMGDDFFDVIGVSASNSQFYPYQLGKLDNTITNAFYSDLSGGIKFDIIFDEDKWILSVNDMEIAEISGLNPIGEYTNYLNFESSFNLKSGNCDI